MPQQKICNITNDERFECSLYGLKPHLTVSIEESKLQDGPLQLTVAICGISSDEVIKGESCRRVLLDVMVIRYGAVLRVSDQIDQLQ